MGKLIGFFVGVASLIATIVTLVGYVLSRNTSLAGFFDEHWDLILSATGLIVLGLIVAGAGMVLLFSTAGSFSALTVPLSLAIVAGGGFLVYLGIAVIVHIEPANASALGVLIGSSSLVG
jgi:hypothetical protein